MNSGEQFRRIVEGRIDAGFVVLVGEQAGLSFEVLRHEHIILGMPKGHRLSKRRHLALAEIADEPAVSFPRHVNPGYYDMIGRLCREAGFALNAVHEADNVDTVLALVKNGLGVALLPSFLRNRNLKGIEFREFKPALPVVEGGLAWKAGVKSAVLDSFLDVARQVGYDLRSSEKGEANEKQGKRV